MVSPLLLPFLHFMDVEGAIKGDSSNIFWFLFKGYLLLHLGNRQLSRIVFLQFGLYWGYGNSLSYFLNVIGNQFVLSGYSVPYDP